jgi:adenosylcobyric acid synthase
LINNFYGDLQLFDKGYAAIESTTGCAGLGIVPHFPDAAKLPAEDAVALEKAARSGTGPFKIAVPRLARIQNFDDLDPLKLESNVELTFLQPDQPLAGDTNLVIIPGSKSTIGDLEYLRQQGWDIDILAHARRGGHVQGICGGYQMLGRTIHDPQGLEGPPGSADGLGLLNVETTLSADKTLTNVTATHCASGTEMTGYEIHLGITHGPDCTRPFATINGQPEGAISPSGRIAGTYLHGTFTSNTFRRAFLAQLGIEPDDMCFNTTIDKTLDDLAGHLETHLDIDRLYDLSEPVA